MPVADLAALDLPFETVVYASGLDGAVTLHPARPGEHLLSDWPRDAYATIRPPRVTSPPYPPLVRAGYGAEGFELVVDLRPDLYYGGTYWSWKFEIERAYGAYVHAQRQARRGMAPPDPAIGVFVDALRAATRLRTRDPERFARGAQRFLGRAKPEQIFALAATWRRLRITAG